MKIFMCINYPIYNPALGLSKKLKEQIDTFSKMNFDVTYSAYSNGEIQIYRGNILVFTEKYLP